MIAMSAAWSPSGNHEYFMTLVDHIREEHGHDQIAINDLKALDGSIDQYQENGLSRSIWETQFYKILKHPSYLFGCGIALETLAAKNLPQLYDRLLKAYPAKACNFVKVHAQEDPQHVSKLLGLTEQCSVSDREEILRSYDQIVDLYYYLLMAVHTESKERSAATAA